MVDPKLIFDIGFHKGEDIGYYLHLGYKVVGLDADPSMVERAKETFRSQYNSGQLRVVNAAMTEKDGDEIDFNISEWTLWNSIRKEIAGRDNKPMTSIKVPTRRLDSVLKEFGTPYYCKIDIEGYDALAVSTIAGSSELPVFTSVETECIGDSEIIDDEKALETLTRLYEAGYRKFKLVDQKTLEVLTMEPFYGRPGKTYKMHRSFMDKLAGRNQGADQPMGHFEFMKRKHNYNFPNSASGPFGEQLEGEWIDHKAARELLLFHRKMFFSIKGVSNYSFWCDWHATV